MLRWLGLVMLLGTLFVSRVEAQEFRPPWLTGESRPEDLTISLATFGPGDEVHQYFGHTALEVRDQRLRVSALYNFGVFSFDETFLLKFLKGHLEFWLGVQPTRLSYEFYADQDRDVVIEELNLSPQKAAQMARDLAITSLPENRTYLYHHYYDNCATRIVDAIDRATDGGFKKAAQGPARMDFRGHTRRYAARDPVIDWLLVFAMNDDMEKPIKRVNEMFLPDELEKGVASYQVTVDGQKQPLVRKRTVFHEAVVKRKVYDVPPTTWPYTLGIGLLIGALFAWTGRRYRDTQSTLSRLGFGALTTLFGLAFGLLGTVLAFLALFTEHQVTYWNENFFFANPLTLVLFVVGLGIVFNGNWAKRAGFYVWAAVAAIAAIGLLLKVLPSMNQDNVLVWTMLLPIELGGFAASMLAREVSAGRVPRAAAVATPSA